MDHKSIKNLNLIINEVELKNKKTKIIAISKTFPIDKIKPLLDYGHLHFGENKVQEAVKKWTDIKKSFSKIKLHLVGKLQTNKVKFVIPLFDYIHSLDSLKLAEKIHQEQIKKNFKPKIFIQVNIGNETQKNGIKVNELDVFVNSCKKDFDLDIVGLMCIPPNDEKTSAYFKKMNELKIKYSFSELSMGMSNDYMIAVDNGASYIRVGSKIFGARSN